VPGSQWGLASRGIASAFKTKGECDSVAANAHNADVLRYNAGYEAQFDNFLRTGGKGNFNPPIRDAVFYTCLLDTVDPRGPKGK